MYDQLCRIHCLVCARWGYSHSLPIRVCAAQRGRDFEAPGLERGSLSIRPSYGAGGEEIFSLPFFPFSPETPDTQAKNGVSISYAVSRTGYNISNA